MTMVYAQICFSKLDEDFTNEFFFQRDSSPVFGVFCKNNEMKDVHILPRKENLSCNKTVLDLLGETLCENSEDKKRSHWY